MHFARSETTAETTTLAHPQEGAGKLIAGRWETQGSSTPPLRDCARDDSSGNLTTRSQLERNSKLALRLGLRYVRGLREEAAQAIVERRRMRPFASIDELARRVPELRKNELIALAEIGALNSLGNENPKTNRGARMDSNGIKSDIRDQKLENSARFHRRDALWQVERAARYPGPLLEKISEHEGSSPLEPMSPDERLVADFRGTGLTVGPHPMAYRRPDLNKLHVRPAIELANIRNGQRVRAAGCVICRQRPGTASGFVFLSLEDETGIANAIITPDLFEQNRLMLVSEQFLIIEGILQNLDGVVSVRAERVQPLHITHAETVSHDFH